MSSLNRAQQQRALLQAQLEATPRRRSTFDVGAPAPIPGTQNSTQSLSPIQVAQNELARLEAINSTLLSKGYTSQHPDMLRNQREIVRAEELLKHLKAAAPLSEKARPSTQVAAGRLTFA